MSILDVMLYSAMTTLFVLGVVLYVIGSVMEYAMRDKK